MSSQTITIQSTNNDNILKFVSTQILINGGSYEFNNIDDAKKSPLAQQLFYLPFVKKVFITANFIAIQRFDIIEWSDVQEEVREQIEAYLQAGNIAVKETDNSRKKEAIEVYAEVTPNPSAMKFGTNKSLTATDVEYKNIEEASKSSPLAQALFGFSFVKGVFISENYISITKFDVVEWNDVYAEVRNFISTYLQDNKTIIKELPKTESTTKKEKEEATTDGLDGTPGKIIAILDEYIRPAVASDGGNIAFKSYDEESKVVSVILQGACSGCPSSTITLKNGIETMLKEMLPNEISEVVAING
ncbi:NifU family protein [Flavobacteriaceae bacterium]|jgi:Fe-S cluster biogenesis protein NfuA|nr:NifU family protein [Flavobacteriaceae bacterium]MDB2555124.1 NifU family protein [Flavobacteriaceae bacterium]MDB4025692.1 NifU family protein [Flavobacteriaceae bacterium]MDB4236789.1 NifU family protein [Flavobacteriaceae bacterium]MDB9781285.1 NifU family protein [Flavobacteriaceae bacterium]|tara:strand:- start:5579 stop:6487 length:909 start_codon:yes stop_codon:yes gene_type:complete